MIEEREFQVIWEHGVREALKRRINLVHFFPDTASIYISLSNEFRSRVGVHSLRTADVSPGSSQLWDVSRVPQWR